MTSEYGSTATDDASRHETSGETHREMISIGADVQHVSARGQVRAKCSASDKALRGNRDAGAVCNHGIGRVVESSAIVSMAPSLLGTGESAK
jgi:hypothetical protein